MVRRLLTIGALACLLVIGVFVLQQRNGPAILGSLATPQEPDPVVDDGPPLRPTDATTSDVFVRTSTDPLHAWLLAHLRRRESGAVERIEVDEADTVRLTGELVRVGRPWSKVPAMRVRLTEMRLDTVMPDQTHIPDELFLGIEARTDDRGRFELEGVPLRESLFLVFQYGARVYEVFKVEDLPWVGQSKDLGQFELEDRGSIRGQVLDAEGDPVVGLVTRAVDDQMSAGNAPDRALRDQRILAAANYWTGGRRQGTAMRDSVRIRDRYLPFPQTTTDRQGNFFLDGVRAGTTSLILNGSQNFGVQEDVIVVVDETTELGKIEVETGGQRQFRLIGQLDTPLAGARVSVQPESWPVSVPAVTTSRGGYFSAFLPEGELSVFFRPTSRELWEPAYEQPAEPTVFPGPPKPTVFYAAPRGRIRVRIVDKMDRDIRNAHVLVYTSDQVVGAKRLFLERRRSTVDRYGRSAFVFENVPVGNAFEAIALAPGFAPGVQPIERGRLREETITIQLRPESDLSVLVVDRDGEPLPNVGIRALFLQGEEPAEPGQHWHLLSEGRPAFLGKTGEDGQLTLEGLWPGRMALAAVHSGFTQTPTPPFALTKGTRAVVRMVRSSRLDGRLLVDARPPERRYEIHAVPREDFNIDYRSNPFFGLHRTVTDDDGKFYFNDLYQGAWVLRVVPPSAPMAGEVEPIWPEGETDIAFLRSGSRVYHEINLRSPPQAYSVHGRVQLGDAWHAASPRVVIDWSPTPETPEGRLGARWRFLSWRLQHTDRESSQRELVREYEKQLAAQSRELAERIRQLRRSGSWWTPEVAKLSREYNAVRRIGQDYGRRDWATESAEEPGRLVAQGELRGESFQFDLRQPGWYTVRLVAVRGGHLQQLANHRFELTDDDADQSREVNFDLPSGDVRIQLFDKNDEPLRGHLVHLVQPVIGAALRVRSDGDGFIYLRGLPAGNYAVPEFPVVTVVAGKHQIYYLRRR